MKHHNRAFTLIEVIITLTILALIFTSVMSVFLYYSTLWAKVETNRLLQSNIKWIIEHITEDIRVNGILIDWQAHEIDPNNWLVSKENKLFVWTSEYYLVRTSDIEEWWVSPSASIVEANDFKDDCFPIEKNCTLIKSMMINGVREKIALSNSWVSFKNIYFHVSEQEIPKVTMIFDMNIAYGKWIKTGLIDNSSINIQTTISERLLDKNK